MNITPATVGSSSDCTTTPTLGRTNSPTRWRYVIAESEFADHQISLTAALTSSTDGTLSNVRCWPAKLASAPSSSAADERTASGAASDWAALITSLIACSWPAATASTIAPDSAIPGGIGSPLRAAAPNPVAFAPNRASSCASASGTTSVTPGPSLRRHRRRRARASRRQCDRLRCACRRRRECRIRARRSPSATAALRCRSRSRRAAAAGC